MHAMRIGAFLKQSLIDWEGRVSAVIFTKGCNFRCGYCHNPYLVLPELLRQTQDIEEHEVLDFLDRRKNWLDGVVISGGEPTLHEDLIPFIQKIKALGLPVKLDTNGSHPEVLEQLIGGKWIDAVAMDIKSALSLSCYRKVNRTMTDSLLERILESVRLVKDSGIEYQFRTTVIPQVQTPEEIQALKKEFLGTHYILQEFRDGDILEKHLQETLPIN